MIAESNYRKDIGDQVDGYSSHASRRAYAGYHVRSGLQVSHPCGKGERSTSLDSFAGRLICRQLLEDARDRRCRLGVTLALVVSSRTGRVIRMREQPNRFGDGPISLNVSSGTRCLDMGEPQLGSDRRRDKAFELCVCAESLVPLVSNLSGQRCHVLAEADGECPEPHAVRTPWLAKAVPRPCSVEYRHSARQTACLQAARGLPPSQSPEFGLLLIQYVLEAPVLEMTKRHTKAVNTSVSGSLEVGGRDLFRTRSGA